MSVRSATTVVVERKYNPSPGACVQALKMLLTRPAIKKAAEPAPEPDGYDDTEGSTNDRTASDKYTL